MRIQELFVESEADKKWSCCEKRLGKKYQNLLTLLEAVVEAHRAKAELWARSRSGLVDGRARFLVLEFLIFTFWNRSIFQWDHNAQLNGNSFISQENGHDWARIVDFEINGSFKACSTAQYLISCAELQKKMRKSNRNKASSQVRSNETKRNINFAPGNCCLPAPWRPPSGAPTSCRRTEMG